MSDYGIVSTIWSWLIRSMKEVVCAVIYWAVYWAWAFFDTAVSALPAWLADPFAQFGSTFHDLFLFLDVFLPLHEVVTIYATYWTVDLCFRGFAVANSIRKV